MKIPVHALFAVAEELAEKCKAETPALMDGEKVIGESFANATYTRLSTYQGDQYIFNYRFKPGGAFETHHFFVKSSSPQLAFVM